MSGRSPDPVAGHIASGRRRVELLGEIREVVFGAQDGLVSTLAVVVTVAAATDDRTLVLIAGLASAVAGVFSMAAGEFLGSRSRAQIMAAELEDERREVAERPDEAEAELVALFREDGVDEHDARHLAATLRRHPEAMLSTMAAKELGLVAVGAGAVADAPGRGAAIMGAAFALGGAVPLLPFLVTGGLPALVAAALLTGLALFALGAVKSRWTGRGRLRAGLEVLSLAVLAGAAGYLLGSVLPTLLGGLPG